MNKALYLCFVLIITVPALSQVNDSPKRTDFRYLKVDIVRSFVDEVPFFYEYSLDDRKSIELKTGIIYSNPLFERFGENWLSSPAFYYWGGLLGAGFRKYRHGTGSGRFWAINAAYKFKFYNDKKLWMGGLGGSSYANEWQLSQTLNVLHVEFLAGYLGYKHRFIGELFYGLGFNLGYANTVVHDCRFCNGHPPNEPLKTNKPYLTSGIFILPSVHMGFHLGSRLDK